ncbi:MAG: Rossman fold protein, TIGR00730 family [Omnitrophica bacterium RIFCSPLOWO2_12_FULL_50_11]|nr:MAG: Rossman fold protein, TIGR00730 family [Omnitrophica bacterium RIFCSPLOWO2_12_FULL_50_11]
MVADSGASENSDLLTQMIVTALKLQDEQIDRGDLKILNTSLKELRWAFRVFRPYRHIHKVSLFGSARTKPNDPVFKAAKEFSSLMVESGWMIVTGGSSGIMHAGNEGAGRARSFGANIRLPFAQAVNPVMQDDRKLIHFKYFFTRKLIFVKESDALCLFPGGFGTLDEGYESLTLVQTGKMMPRPIVLFEPKGGTYWRSWLAFLKRSLLAQNMIDRDDLNLFEMTNSVREARDLIVNFYRIYHSMRFVGDRLVLRLKRPLGTAELSVLNRSYQDLLVKGKIESSGPLAAESNDSHTASLPRLILHFDKKSFGRLKAMIKTINQMGE